MRPMSFLVALAACLLVSAALAQQYRLGAIEIDHPWSRATPKGAKAAAGYVTIKNTGPSSDRLVGGTLTDAARVEVHEMSMTDGVMKMRPMQSGIEIKPGDTVELKPGGFHMMFMDLKAPLAKGAHVRGTLVFANAGTVEVEYTVEDIGQQSMPGMHPMR